LRVGYERKRRSDTVARWRGVERELVGFIRAVYVEMKIAVVLICTLSWTQGKKESLRQRRDKIGTGWQMCAEKKQEKRFESDNVRSMSTGVSCCIFEIPK
jgi:hypothetical protein